MITRADIQQKKIIASELEAFYKALKDDLKKKEDEFKRLNTEMPVTMISEFLGCDRSTVYRKLDMPASEGGLRSKKMNDVLEYAKKNT